ncbi:MAG: hypothetical protein KAR39_08400 [Thermoplasmata archaeon]|nr:hypothetical protein [Thermoplasmata archaeon]
MPERLEGYSVDTVFDNPPLFPWVFSFVSKKTREKIEWLLGPLADTIQVIVIFGFVLLVSENYTAAFLGGLVFSVVPILIKPDARTFFFSPRPYGELFAALAVLSALLFILHADMLYVASSVLFVSLVLLTGKFPTQAVVFAFLGLSVYYLTFWFLLIMALGFLLSIAISKGYYLKTLKAHLRHSGFYRKTIVYRHSWTRTISGMYQLRSIFSRGSESKVKARTVLLRNPVVNALAFTPFLPLLWIVTPFSWDTILGDGTLTAMFVWANLMFIIVLIISSRQLRFLGEAERYMGFGVVPLCYLIPVLLLSLGSFLMWTLFWVVITYSAVLVGFNYRVSATYFAQSKEERDASLEFFTFLQSLPSGKILCVPANISPEITHKTHHSTLYWGGSLPGKNFGHDEFNEIYAEFPAPNRQLGTVASKYGMDFIVFSSKGLEKDGEKDYDLGGYEMIFRNEEYSVYGRSTVSRSS